MKTALQFVFTLAASVAALGLSHAAPSSEGTKPKTVTLESCSWNKPGHNPYMGEVPTAVDRYQDIPAEFRARLRERMAKRQFDDWVIIRRDSIAGEHSYQSDITDMHFGQNSVCRKVNRIQWKDDHQERGLVYCESGYCILVPTICRNVSRIVREAPRKAAGLPVNTTPLDFEPPAAGANPAEGPAAFAPTDVDALAAAPSAGGALIPAGASPTAGFPVPIFAVGGSGPGPSNPGNGTTNPGTGPISGGGTTPGAPPQVTPIPEPSTWVLALGGLAAVIFVARRRKIQ